VIIEQYTILPPACQVFALCHSKCRESRPAFWPGADRDRSFRRSGRGTLCRPGVLPWRLDGAAHRCDTARPGFNRRQSKTTRPTCRGGGLCRKECCCHPLRLAPTVEHCVGRSPIKKGVKRRQCISVKIEERYVVPLITFSNFPPCALNRDPFGLPVEQSLASSLWYSLDPACKVI